MRTLRHPLLPAGLLLVAVGFGNWYTGIDKGAEYERLLASGSRLAPVEHLEDFHELNSRTAATLLSSLQHGSDDDTIVNAKADFYKVVQSGGRMLILLGLFCAAAGVIRSWYRQRIADRSALSVESL